MGIHFKQRKQNCTINNLNIRKELHGDKDKILGVDIKIAVNVPVGFLDTIAIDKGQEWGAFFYKESGDLKDTGFVAVVKCNRDFSGHDAEITIGEEHMTFKDVKIKSISAELLDGRRILLEYTIQAHPTKEEVAILTEGLQEAVTVKIDGGSQKDIEEDSEEEGDAD